jgi:hypothetical protein
LSKSSLLLELVNLVKDNPHPMIIGRDFNSLGFTYEKSRGRFDDQWSFLFSVVIDSINLREVLMIGRQFTQANSLPELIYAKLDRVLMGLNWESKFSPVYTLQLRRRLCRIRIP